MKKFSAYTIVELMVVCILTTFVVIIAMQCIRLINTQYENYETNQVLYKELGDLNSLLRRDNLGALRVFRDARILTFEMDTIGIQYRLDKDFVIRKSMLGNIRPDTFRIGVNTVNTSFKKEVRTRGLVDYIDLGLFFDETELRISLQKQYSAAELMNTQAYAR